MILLNTLHSLPIILNASLFVNLHTSLFYIYRKVKSLGRAEEYEYGIIFIKQYNGNTYSKHFAKNKMITTITFYLGNRSLQIGFWCFSLPPSPMKKPPWIMHWKYKPSHDSPLPQTFTVFPQRQNYLLKPTGSVCGMKKLKLTITNETWVTQSLQLIRY